MSFHPSQINSQNDYQVVTSGDKHKKSIAQSVIKDIIKDEKRVLSKSLGRQASLSQTSNNKDKSSLPDIGNRSINEGSNFNDGQQYGNTHDDMITGSIVNRQFHPAQIQDQISNKKPDAKSKKGNQSRTSHEPLAEITISEDNYAAITSFNQSSIDHSTVIEV